MNRENLERNFNEGGELENKEREINEKIKSLAGVLHDEWREPRYREETNDYEPRIKSTKDQSWIESNDGKTEIDIANTSYENLPSDWQKENKASAEVAISEIEKAVNEGVELNDSFIESASAAIHDKWLERNSSWAPPEQNVPYKELSEEEKEKDRAIIRKAMNLYNNEE